ncbi:MAG TPA: neutral zinc metallopeptidase, partial [Vicinamibacterales bacterium]
MRTEGQRKSDNFEDRGTGRGMRAGGGVPIAALAGLVRILGWKGTLILGAIALVAYFFLPGAVKEQVFSGDEATGQVGSSSVCQASPANGAACDFSRVVLASTEDVWAPIFAQQAMPSYGAGPGAYQNPTLVVFANAVSTDGCGSATSAVGPFYCPADGRLYIDPSFYDVMEKRLRAPGDFAQAYVLAHEVGHHVQNLIGSTSLRVQGDTSNQTSVRVELQADCFAGVWGRSARSALQITDEDLGEALTAAHAIGDDRLGQSNERNFTHGSSEQRKRWFRRGFETGDARQCDTFNTDYR